MTIEGSEKLVLLLECSDGTTATLVMPNIELEIPVLVCDE